MKDTKSMHKLLKFYNTVLFFIEDIKDLENLTSNERSQLYRSKRKNSNKQQIILQIKCIYV